MKITEKLVEKKLEKVKEQLNDEYGEFEVDTFIDNSNFFYEKSEYLQIDDNDTLQWVDWNEIVDEFILENADDDEQIEHWRTMYRENGIDYFLYDNKNDYDIDLFRKFIEKRDIYNYEDIINRFPEYEDIKNDERMSDYWFLKHATTELHFYDESELPSVAIDDLKAIIKKYNQKSNKP